MATQFRADNSGSLLRPPEWIEARAAHREGRINSEGLREIEDRATAVIFAAATPVEYGNEQRGEIEGWRVS